jgi:hypothetical protein
MAANKNELQLQVYLTEYQKLRDEIMYFQGNLYQNVILSLGSASVAIPLLVGQLSNVPSVVIASLLFALAIVYSTLGIQFSYASYAIGAIGQYIHQYLHPAINKLNPTSKYKGLFWETFVREARSGFPDSLLAGLGTAGVILMILPSAISLFTASYVLSISSNQASQSNFVRLVSSGLPWLSAISWIAFIVFILSFVLVVYFHTGKTHSLIINNKD